jgi:hypothetical protein
MNERVEQPIGDRRVDAEEVILTTLDVIASPWFTAPPGALRRSALPVPGA